MNLLEEWDSTERWDLELIKLDQICNVKHLDMHQQQKLCDGLRYTDNYRISEHAAELLPVVHNPDIQLIRTMIHIFENQKGTNRFKELCIKSVPLLFPKISSDHLKEMVLVSVIKLANDSPPSIRTLVEKALSEVDMPH